MDNESNRLGQPQGGITGWLCIMMTNLNAILWLIYLFFEENPKQQANHKNLLCLPFSSQQNKIQTQQLCFNKKKQCSKENTDINWGVVVYNIPVTAI